MPRRAGAKGPRAARTSAVSTGHRTPKLSAGTTPATSANPSTYASEAEHEADQVTVDALIGTLSLQDNAPTVSRIRRLPKKPFPFMELPPELRIKVYGYHFADCEGEVIDLEPDNYKRIHGKLRIFRVSRAFYAEATHFFYSTRTFRLFPTHQWGRFFKTKKPLLARLKPEHRSKITSLELRLGPGWSQPPRGWVVNDALGLRDCVNVRKMTVYVECDPSDDIFKGFRRSVGFYENFCRTLLENVLAEMPLLLSVQFDANTSVKKSGPLVQGLLAVVHAQGRTVSWGPRRGWSDQDELEEETVPAANPNRPLVSSGGLNITVLA